MRNRSFKLRILQRSRRRDSSATELDHQTVHHLVGAENPVRPPDLGVHLCLRSQVRGKSGAIAWEMPANRRSPCQVNGVLSTAHEPQAAVPTEPTDPTDQPTPRPTTTRPTDRLTRETDWTHRTDRRRVRRCRIWLGIECSCQEERFECTQEWARRSDQLALITPSYRELNDLRTP
jgi:hypothetical protein